MLDRMMSDRTIIPSRTVQALSKISHMFRGNLAYPSSQHKATDPYTLCEGRNFLVKILSSRREYLNLQKLRYDVFHREFRNKKFPFGLDFDRFDSYAQHVLVIDKTANKIVGGYRMIQSDVQERLYTATEFDFEFLSHLPGKKLELSRACIHKDYRNGAVLSLLWRGIGEYLLRENIDYLIGIPSFKNTDPMATAALYAKLEHGGHIANEFSARPHNNFQLPQFCECLQLCREELARIGRLEYPVQVPPLFLSYFKAGAKVVGTPALDDVFGCVDFFMILDMQNMSPSYRRKFTQSA